MALIKFTVEGSGPFPFDMLRYDACWPASENDSAVLERMDREARRHRTVFTLTLATTVHVTEARWESFGWKVVTP
jgi:hypothetical protein